MAKKKYVNKFGIGLLLGAAAGYLVSYLTAPKSGEALQNELSEKTNKLKEKTDEVVTKIKDKTAEFTPDTHTEAEPNVFVTPDKPTVPVQDMASEEILPNEVTVAQSNETLMDSSIEEGTPVEK